MRFLLAALFAFGTLGLARADGDSEAVHKLDASSFDGFVKANEITLVEFFAPWCGHCKQLAPQYEAAAKQLKDNNIPLASVDCTTEKDLCSEYGVQGFPTLKIFRSSAPSPSEYQGGRTTNDIVKFMKKQTEPAYIVIQDAEFLSKVLSEHDEGSFLLGVFNDVSSAEAQEFIATANALRNDHSFAIVTDASLATQVRPAGVTAPAVILVKKPESAATDAVPAHETVVYSGPFESGALSTFINVGSFPLVGEIGPENFQKYLERGYPLVWLFLEAASPLTEPTLQVAREVAAEFKGKLSLVRLDGVRWAEHAKHFGIKTGEFPGIVVEDRENSKNYVFPFSKEITADNLRAHFQGFLDKTIQPNLKSQAVPESNDGPLTTLVGTNFDAIVNDNSKDVLVEFYAPWCGHCKQLAPKYEALAKIFEDNENVVIAQVDATENDTPAQIKGFPTIILYPAGDKSNPLTYSGERTESAMADWIRANGKTFSGASTTSETSSTHTHDDL